VIHLFSLSLFSGPEALSDYKVACLLVNKEFRGILVT
jgi:hypothetical protein